MKRRFKRKILIILVVLVIGVVGVTGARTRSGEIISPLGRQEELSWEEDLKLHLFEPVEVKWVSAETLAVKLKNGVEVNFSPQKERLIQFDSLQLILDQHKMGRRPVRRVDLRYDKPVVVYE
ncbi:MAG: hypothetical protein ABH807_01350 [Candidatus Shapirobacteria bacterium]